ncbi:MAG: hypothetical protein HC853_06380 [Anaerolineae bacterium]|nr:hypothetical protein [Anaerolineae bacterium]
MVTDTRGYATTAQYDATGDYLLATTNTLGHTSRFEYYGANGQPLQNNTWGSTLGLLKRKVPPNGDDAATSYSYDVYGRLLQAAQPGDTEAAPTVRYAYSDGATGFAPPLKIESWQREQAGCAECVHKRLEFYDGLGQLLQTRIETVNDVQQRVMSYGYDVLGRAIYQSVPISVTDPTPNGAVFNNYAAPDWNALLKTQTDYDAAGRTVRVRHVDGTATESSFIGATTVVTDANGHRKEQQADGFGRLQRVTEYLDAARQLHIALRLRRQRQLGERDRRDGQRDAHCL